MRSYYVTDHWNIEYVQSIVFESHIPSSLDLPTLLEVLADIVAQTGATVDSFETVFFKKESHEKNMVDIGVLRFPDTDHPYFQVG